LGRGFFDKKRLGFENFFDFSTDWINSGGVICGLLKDGNRRTLFNAIFYLYFEPRGF